MNRIALSYRNGGRIHNAVSAEAAAVISAKGLTVEFVFSDSGLAHSLS